MSQKTLDRLEHLRKLNSNRQWVNHELYRLLASEELYVVAYERIKSKPGNMTPVMGSDQTAVVTRPYENFEESG
jgi:nicotine oxidoreductase